VGEIGIDLYWDKTWLAQQQEVFRQQVRWAKELALPVVIHCRQSFEETMAIVEEENDEDLRGVFHCFTGTDVRMPGGSWPWVASCSASAG
jgi:TatD DNase family protein